MIYLIEISKFAAEDLAKLDKPIIIQILQYLNKDITECNDPTKFGKLLTGDLSGLYLYRAGDYRIVCILEQVKLTVVAIVISHRKNIYQKLRLVYRKLADHS